MNNLVEDKKEAGFTLVEVLVSLLIFAVAILGLTRAGTQTVSTLNQLEEKTYASIVADNQLALARLESENPFAQSREGEEQSGGRTFEYRVERVETEVPEFFELVVSVSSPRTDQILIQRRAFVTGEAS
ncbi:type II secretion system minor pseudopilin GspI [Litorimonas haliclonae]|uniref:type II secretion system minor pseudopilin GspI n=1 Tax=Litorimonas haliclonae TaxID=2081977 RepID=UPI0039F00FC3